MLRVYGREFVAIPRIVYIIVTEWSEMHEIQQVSE